MLEQLFIIFQQVFTAMIGWLTSVVGLFYADNALTFFGTLAVVSLSISVFFLLVRVVQNFLHFRG